jgi:ribosomal protein S18 acetylase RimI-like enzyme
MHIRPLEVDDHPATTDLLTDTFRAFFEGYARPHLGEQVFQHQHGHWEQDYRDELPTLHAPEAGRHAAVATLAEGTIVGLISWRVDTKARHGEIYLLAVSPLHQRQHIGERLCQHAIAHMRADKVELVQISTGGDPFHTPARALYERLGFTLVPVAVYLGVI